MADALRILLIEDDLRIRESAERTLHALGHDVVVASSAEAIEILDADATFDVVIAGEAPPSESSSEAPAPSRPLPTLLHLPRPIDSDVVVAALAGLRDRAQVREQLQRAAEALAEASSSGSSEADAIIGRSPAIEDVLQKISAVGESHAPVLLTGESGTGKDLLARTIHAQSPRRNKPFVVINCAAFPDALLEAELFGHERGAFTGALQKRDGRFKAADGGTLFLDEVNSLSLSAQAKLLRVLQDGTFEPIGTNATLAVDVRIVSATNRDLKALVADAKFREDLYYRIKVLDIEVPPLRARRGDIPLLVQHFLEKYTPPDRVPPSVSPGAWAALMQHLYPGNVRELEHAIHRATVLSRGAEIDVEHLPKDIAPKASGMIPAVRGPEAGKVRPLADALGEFEREYLLAALRTAGGNKTKAARLLGISRKNLWQKLTRVLPELEVEPGVGTKIESSSGRDTEHNLGGDEGGESDTADSPGGRRRRASRSAR